MEVELAIPQPLFHSLLNLVVRVLIIAIFLFLLLAMIFVIDLRR